MATQAKAHHITRTEFNELAFYDDIHLTLSRSRALIQCLSVALGEANEDDMEITSHVALDFVDHALGLAREWNLKYRAPRASAHQEAAALMATGVAAEESYRNSTLTLEQIGRLSDFLTDQEVMARRLSKKPAAAKQKAKKIR
jgi:hypothetical protein